MPPEFKTLFQRNVVSVSATTLSKNRVNKTVGKTPEIYIYIHTRAIEREAETQTDRQRQRHTGRETERESDRQTERDRQIDRGMEGRTERWRDGKDGRRSKEGGTEQFKHIHPNNYYMGD